MRHSVVVILMAMGCGSGHPAEVSVDAALVGDGAVDRVCPMGHEDKLAFTSSTACSNDGSVEFCVPDGNPDVIARLMAVSPAITCGPGGGRAGCVTGQLLCYYPTTFPAQCVTEHGGATDVAWSQLCQLAAFPEISKIVATILE